MSESQQVVLITGGAKGVGRGITRSFLQSGATVVITARNAPETEIEENGQRAQYIATDIRDVEACQQLIQQVVNEHGRLDVLINNAGGSPFAMADAASPRFHEAIIRLNLLAPLNLAQAANTQMQKQPSGGVVINIGSVSADRPSPGTAAYGAAKAGLLNLTLSLAVEWAPKVRVTAVSPGPVLTEQAHLHFGDEDGVAAVASTIPMQRLAAPDDIGQACVWLASKNAAYVTGSNLVLHGGGEKPAFLDKATANQN
ncbi:MAG: SDR family oxidoreductase [Oceanococcus sp.]